MGEDFIIRIRSLDDAHAALQDSTDPSKLQKVRRGYCDLHGSMILLLHWSLLNFIAVIKILKKHDKHSGVLLRRPLLANVLKRLRKPLCRGGYSSKRSFPGRPKPPLGFGRSS